MTEGKHGRLFTERDVRAIVGEALTDGMRFCRVTSTAKTMEDALNVLIKLAEADKAPMTFPPDEPLFLLRAQDIAAWASVQHYAVQCDVLPGISAEHGSAAHDAADAFHEWQVEHPDRVKVPD